MQLGAVSDGGVLGQKKSVSWSLLLHWSLRMIYLFFLSFSEKFQENTDRICLLSSYPFGQALSLAH